MSKYVQMMIFSDEKKSTALLTILAAKTLLELSSAVEAEPDYWKDVFKRLSVCDFSNLKDFSNYTHKQSHSYITITKALEIIHCFAGNNDIYETLEHKRKIFSVVLNGLPFIEAHMFHTLVFGKYDKVLINDWLHPHVAVSTGNAQETLNDSDIDEIETVTEETVQTESKSKKVRHKREITQ